jgi:hypothetical protein
MIVPNEDFWKAFKRTEGAFSTAEAIALYNIALQVERPIISIELGTHKGKSAMAAAVALDGGEFILVDPIFSDDGLRNLVQLKVSSFSEKLFVRLMPTTSIDAIQVSDFYSYAFIDSGSHGDGLPMQEAKLLEDKIVNGGIIAWHDYKNQFTEVEQAYNYILSTGKYERIEINWSEIFDYVKEHNLEEGNNSWHLYPELPHPPNFVGALKRK